jgi:hypothetical protein
MNGHPICRSGQPLKRTLLPASLGSAARTALLEDLIVRLRAAGMGEGQRYVSVGQSAPLLAKGLAAATRVLESQASCSYLFQTCSY